MDFGVDVIIIVKKDFYREDLHMKKAAVMNDLSGFGKCSLTAAIPVLSAMGVQCCPLPSAVLTGQTGYEFYYSKDLTDMIPSYTEAWQKNNVHFDAIYSGYMTGGHQISHFMNFIDVFYKDDTFLLTDPVMGDDGSTYPTYSQELLDSMKLLTKKADLITPNLTEACLLTDTDFSKVTRYSDKENLLKAAEEIALKLRDQADKKNGSIQQDVVITGIKCIRDSVPFIYNLAATNNGVFTNKSHFFNRSFSGTGDLFASVMCGARMNDIPTEEAIKLASSFLYHSIADTMNDDTAAEDGVNFEKFLTELIIGK